MGVAQGVEVARRTAEGLGFRGLGVWGFRGLEFRV